MGTAQEDLDPATWNELLELFGRDGVAEMITALQSDLPQRQRQLADALAAEDRNALKRIAHSLRGVALQFGAAALAQSCGEIEQAVAAQAPTAQLGVDTARVLDRYAALVQGLQDALHGA
ncbi:MAG: Hpt domain-containing protein [Pseudomonadota bacterium]